MNFMLFIFLSMMYTMNFEYEQTGTLQAEKKFQTVYNLNLYMIYARNNKHYKF